MPWQSPWSEARTRAWSCSTNSMPTTGWPVSAQRRATATWRLPGRRPASRSSATSTPRPPVSLTTSDVRSEPVAATSLVRRPEGVPTTGGEGHVAADRDPAASQQPWQHASGEGFRRGALAESTVGASEELNGPDEPDWPVLHRVDYLVALL